MHVDSSGTCSRRHLVSYSIVLIDKTLHTSVNCPFAKPRLPQYTCHRYRRQSSYQRTADDPRHLAVPTVQPRLVSAQEKDLKSNYIPIRPATTFSCESGSNHSHRSIDSSFLPNTSNDTLSRYGFDLLRLCSVGPWTRPTSCAVVARMLRYLPELMTEHQLYPLRQLWTKML